METQELTELGQLDIISALSQQNGIKAVAVFKHSTRCYISQSVWRAFQKMWAYNPNEFPLYYLDLIRFRNISNQLAADYGVEHQSPQLLIIRNGKCIYNASHDDIAVDKLERFVQ